MPRAKVSRAAPKLEVENVDKVEKVSNGIEKITKNKTRGRKAKPENDVVENGKVKERGKVSEVFQKKVEESELHAADKITKKVKVAKQKAEAPVTNGEEAEGDKPKRGRTRKAVENKPVKETIKDEVASSSKNVRTTKKSKGTEVAKDKPMPSVSAGRGRKRKAEGTADIEIIENMPKATAKTKQNAEAKANEPPASSSKSEKKTSKRGNKKGEEKSYGESIVEIAEKTSETKTTTKATGRKRGAAKAENDDKEQADSKPPKTKKALLNPTETLYNKADFELSMDGNLSNASNSGVERSIRKISSWNVAGLRSWLKKDGLTFLKYEEPDIFCLQEIKCTTDQMPEEIQRIPGYHPYWLCLPGGYAGVALYSKIMPINVEYGIGNEEFDDAGRLITAEYEKFYLINVYVPNSGRKLVNLDARMRWETLFQAYIKKLDGLKPVIVCGDMNVSHKEIDLANPKTNTRSAGFTIEERDKMTELLSLGFLDTFRQLYPDKVGAYTYWTYMANARARNVGWRLDYFIVSERIGKRVIENAIRSNVLGSDHCPITLFINI